MTDAPLEVPLIPHRSAWELIRWTWGPLLIGSLVVFAAAALQRAAPQAAAAVAGLSGLAFVGVAITLLRKWQRGGPRLRIGDGVLAVGARQAPVAEVHASVGAYVFDSQARFAPGRFWLPLLVLRLGADTEVRIACQGAGGPAGERRKTPAPHYLLERDDWDRVAAEFGVSRARD